MLASGNSNVMVCIGNIIKTVRGEVPYERLLGINPNIIDMPSKYAAVDMTEDIEWLISTYEPRANLKSVDLQSIVAQTGDFLIQAKLNRGETL